MTRSFESFSQLESAQANSNSYKQMEKERSSTALLSRITLAVAYALTAGLSEDEVLAKLDEVKDIVEARKDKS